MGVVRVGLVACSKGKAAVPSRACELYTSPLFTKASSYCGRHYDVWFVLSALHGLLGPDEVIEPYEHTLVGQSGAERREWAARVAGQIAERGLSGSKFYLHAGRCYAGVLSEVLGSCRTPLSG